MALTLFAVLALSASPAMGGPTAAPSRPAGSVAPSNTDHTPPTLVIPAPFVRATASDFHGARVTYDVRAYDAVDGSVLVSCYPASGARFPVGPTSVDCHAADSHGNAAARTFVIIVDPPIKLTVPPDMTVQATSTAGAAVTFQADAAWTVGLPPAEAPSKPAPIHTLAVNCIPASGSTFPLGTSVVTCTATHEQESQHSVSRPFRVRVVPRGQ